MSIYSTNRMGHAASATVVANEAYTGSELGRVLYESQVNDMAIFEAVIASDLKECEGLREGTLLESEIAAFTEASVKEFFKAMGDRIKEFWGKIKGAFKAVIQKISAYVLKDGKAYVAEFEKAYAKLGGNYAGEIKAKLYDMEQHKKGALAPANEYTMGVLRI